MDEVSSMHTIPLTKWITDREVKFWGDNVRRRHVTYGLTIMVKWCTCTVYSLARIIHLLHSTLEMILQTTEDIKSVLVSHAHKYTTEMSKRSEGSGRECAEIPW